MKKTLLVLAVLGGIIGGFAILYGLSATSESTYADAPTPTPFMVDARIVAVGAQVGLTQSQLSTVHAQLGACHDAKATACYENATETMFIRPETMASPKLPTVLAHEYLHYVWYKMLGDQGRKITGDSLMVMYSRNDYLGTELRWRLEPYVNLGDVPGTDAFNTELHSIWCTEVADNRMNASSLEYCSRYIPGRNALQNTIF